MPHTPCRLALLLTLGLPALWGCAPEPDFGGASVDVEACAGDANLEDALAFALAFDDSAQAMVVCGAIAYQFLGAVVGSALTFAEGDTDWQERVAFDAGTYQVVGTGVTLDLTLSFGPESPGGPSGDVLSGSVFVPESWLTDATAEQEGDNLVVSFAESGPLASLLGKGASPESPLTFSPDDLDAIALNLTTLLLDVHIAVEDEASTHRFAYSVNAPSSSIEALILERVLAYQLDEASGARAALDQTAAFPSWDLRYLDGPNPTLQGTVALEVTGGPFDHQAQYLYLAEDPDPSVSVTCL